jgi:G3E family GTPase
MINYDLKKLYLVNGFLGAGKTTFMHNLAEHFRGEKVAIVVNEFGKIGMDGLLLQEEGICVEEISNGSIFCNCRSDTFINALVRISQFPVNTVLVESSGLSDPTGMGKILSIVQNLAKNVYDYKGAIAIVDATNFQKLVNTAYAVKAQIVSSDLIIINKIDLVEKDILDSIEKMLKKINPLVSIVRTSYGEILSPDWITSLSNKAGLDDMNIKKSKVVGIQKFTVSMEGEYNKNTLESWIREFSPYIYRIKGFVSIDNKWHYVDGTSNELDISSTEIVPQGPSIVILASGDQPVKRNMAESWNRHFKNELRLL